MAAERALKDYFAPITANLPTCIVLLPNAATQFKIRPATISMLPSFHGLNRENPYTHLSKFLNVYATFRNQNLDEENVRLRLFPFSL